MLFSKKTLIWRFYITNKTLLTNEQVQIIDKKNFIIVILDVDSKIFVIHKNIREQEKMLVHSKK